jgi:predicted Zn-dependent peptidase
MIKLGQLDGVPVVHTDDGPPLAGLVFRVGSADELLSQRGITHLIEHLALHRLGTTDYHFNGTTAPYFTSFFTRGDQATAVSFLQQVATSLNNLPIDRLEIERGVLRTEEDGRALTIGRRMNLWRYGAVGLGATSYGELGLSGFHPHDLTRWVSRYFTRENAVLWFSGMELPTDLTLGLPTGTREPIVESVSVLPKTPAYHPELPQHLGLHAVVGRSTAAMVFAAVLQRELFRRMRQESGYCYTPTADYTVIDADRAAIVAIADLAPELREAALGEFIDTIASMQWGKLSPSLLEEVKTTFRTGLTEPGAEASRLPGAAMNLLLGRPIIPIDALRAEVDAVTIADLYVVAAEVAANALLLTPAGLEADWAGYARVSDISERAVNGRPFVPINNPGETLVIGVDGVTAATEAGPLTVLYEDCQAMLMRPDGARTLIGRDGVSFTIEPTLFALPDGMIDIIDQHVPPERVVRLPARSPDQIPMPPPDPAAPSGDGERSEAEPGAVEAAAQPTAAVSRRLGPAARAGVILAIVVLGLLDAFLLLLLLAAFFPDPSIDRNGLEIAQWFFAVLTAVCTGGIVALSVRLGRR